MKDIRKEITPLVQSEDERNKTLIKKLEDELKDFFTQIKKRDFYKYQGVAVANEALEKINVELKAFTEKIEYYGTNAVKFGSPDSINASIKQLEAIQTEVENMKILWEHIDLCLGKFESYMKSKWVETNPFDMEDECKKLMRSLKEMKVDKKQHAYNGILEDIKAWLIFLPLIGDLRDDAMRDRHWQKIKDKVQKDFSVDDKLLLKDVFELNLGKYKEDVEEITDQARQEAKMEKTLKKLDETWKDICFEFTKHKDTDIKLLKINEDDFDMLEENQVSVNAMFSSRYLSTFEEQCVYWQKSLAAISEVVQLLGEVQRSWSFLENLFIHSEEVKKELPKESERFVGIDQETKAILKEGDKAQKALVFCTREDIYPRLEKIQDELTICQKALNEFMDSKRTAFPRFYFVSPDDLLDILSNGNNPKKIMCHMTKIF